MTLSGSASDAKARQSTCESTREGGASSARPPVRTLPVKAVNSKALELRGYKYLCAWVFIVGLHCICALYLVQLARVYRFFLHPYMEYWTKLIARERRQYFGSVGLVFGFIGVMHIWQVASILWASFRARELVLLDGSSSITSRISNRLSKRLLERSGSQTASRVSTAFMSAHFKRLALPSRFIFNLWRFFFSRHGVFGIESDFFPVVFIVREVVEIVSQTFQAHRSSESLPRPWLNNLFVTLVVVNCWSTPILQRFLRHHEGTERVICLLLDTVLNMGSSILIPIIVFAPYYAAFIPEAFSFPYESLYDGLFFSRLAMENQLLFSLSNADVFSRLVPHLGIFSSLASVATLIHRKGSRRQSRVLSAKSIEKPRLATFSKTATMLSSSVATSALGQTSKSFAARASRKKKTLVHASFFAWGLALLVLHIRGTTRAQATVVGCRQVTGSWFTTAYPCSVYAYNCFRQGTRTPDEESMKELDQSSLVYLTISHCPELKVPHRLQTFPNLLGFQLHNTTIVEWSKENSISATKHKKMVVVVIAKTNMSGIPDGMLEPLPDTLMDIELTYTNLTTLPENLHEKWHPLACMYFEHSLLTEFPKALLSLEVTELSLHGNMIERLPEFELTHQYFSSFVASANPLVELPELLGEDTMFWHFSAENTLLKTLPAWLHTAAEVVYLYGTPYCETQTGDMPAGAYLACEERDDRINGKCAFEIFDPRIPLYQ